jgi:hypothetical protein
MEEDEDDEVLDLDQAKDYYRFSDSKLQSYT